ncbi:MAG TPA: thioredoxin, partial [bacterium]|nr:thioredoxin [bacterium]HQI95050.1 thioredoxin [bacterium]
ELTPANFATEVLNSKIPVLVDFWAPWCGPCQMMAPILENLAQELGDKIKIAKVNVDDPDNQPLAVEYQIQSIPNMKLFKNGEEIASFIGVRQQASLRQDILDKLS